MLFFWILSEVMDTPMDFRFESKVVLENEHLEGVGGMWWDSQHDCLHSYPLVHGAD